MKKQNTFFILGELNSSVIPKFGEILCQSLNNSDIIVDLSKVINCDIVGLGILIELAKIAKKNSQKIIFTHLSKQLRSLMASVKVDSILPLAVDSHKYGVN